MGQSVCLLSEWAGMQILAYGLAWVKHDLQVDPGSPQQSDQLAHQLSPRHFTMHRKLQPYHLCPSSGHDCRAWFVGCEVMIRGRCAYIGYFGYRCEPSTMAGAVHQNVLQPCQ